MILKQGVNYVRVFTMVATLDHVTAVTGITPTVNISKAGAAFAAATGTVAEIANGFYKITLSVADVGTIGDLAFRITGTGADNTRFIDQVETQVFSDLLLSSGYVAMASSIKQNQALSGFTFLMTNSSTNAPITGLTVTAQRSLSGAGFSPCANSVSEISNGFYKINLAAADLNSPVVALHFSASGANDTDLVLITQP